MAIDKTAPAVPAAPAAPLPAGETVDAYDAMASAFDSLVEPVAAKEEEASSPVKDEVVEPPAGKVEDAPAGEVTPDATPATPEATPDVAPAGETEEVDWEARYKELDAKTKAQPAPETPPPVETPPPDAAPLYSSDETEFLKKYDEEWSDVARGEALKRRAEYRQLVAHVFKEVSRVYDPLVERGVHAAETVAETTTLAAIRAVHPDYDDPMYDSVISWADSLTGYRKKFAQSVIEEGDPQDVVDLISEYKSAKGLSKPRVVASAPATPAAPAVTELTATAKKAAKALGVVDSKRSAATPNVTDPDDFDSAWDEAVGK